MQGAIWTAFMTACRSGNVQCTNAMIAAGVDVNATSDDGSTALTVACSNGSVQCTRALIKAKACLEHTGRGGCTALMMACRLGHVECTRELLRAGADYNRRNDDGHTALHITCIHDKDKCAAALADAGADMKRFANGGTPIQMACICKARRVSFRLVALGVVGAGALLHLRFDRDYVACIHVHDEKPREWALAQLDELRWSPVTNDLLSRLGRDNVRFVLWLAMQLQRKYGLSAQLVDVFIDVLIPFVVQNMPKPDRVETFWEIYS